MLVTLKVSHSELLQFECQIRGNLVDGRKVMEPSCLKCKIINHNQGKRSKERNAKYD